MTQYGIKYAVHIMTAHFGNLVAVCFSFLIFASEIISFFFIFYVLSLFISIVCALTESVRNPASKGTSDSETSYTIHRTYPITGQQLPSYSHPT